MSTVFSNTILLMVPERTAKGTSDTILNQELTTDEVVKRYRQVGGVPSIVFCR
jgi:hypothetical protein